MHINAAHDLPPQPPPLPQTLLNDCKDLDPTIRGLAVRSMAGLRVPELMDSVVRQGGLLPLLAHAACFFMAAFAGWICFRIGHAHRCLH